MSTAGSLQLHGPSLRSAPQVGHMPLQSSVQTAFIGTATKICSRTAGAKSSSSPLKE